MKFLKHLMILSTLATAYSCKQQDVQGHGTVYMNMAVSKSVGSSKRVDIPAGRYGMGVAATKKKLKFALRNINDEIFRFETKLPKNKFYRSIYTDFKLSSSELGQPISIIGDHVSKTKKSKLKKGTTSCVYDSYNTESCVPGHYEDKLSCYFSTSGEKRCEVDRVWVSESCTTHTHNIYGKRKRSYYDIVKTETVHIYIKDMKNRKVAQFKLKDKSYPSVDETWSGPCKLIK